MLRVLLDYAISIDLIAINAAKGVEVIGSRKDEVKRIVPPSKEIMRQLIELADGRFRVMLLFAAATGVRAGEFHALRWCHIDFDRREVLVETRVDAYRQEDVPKTRAGLRTIPLGEAVIEAAALLAQAHRLSLAERSPVPQLQRRLLESRRHGEIKMASAVQTSREGLAARAQE
jgi:integrase